MIDLKEKSWKVTCKDKFSPHSNAYRQKGTLLMYSSVGHQLLAVKAQVVPNLSIVNFLLRFFEAAEWYSSMADKITLIFLKLGTSVTFTDAYK